MPKKRFETLQKGLSAIGLLIPDFIHKAVDRVEYHVPVLFNMRFSVVPVVERFGSQSREQCL